jgi:hypothetical protein
MTERTGLLFSPLQEALISLASLLSTYGGSAISEATQAMCYRHTPAPYLATTRKLASELTAALAAVDAAMAEDVNIAAE